MSTSLPPPSKAEVLDSLGRTLAAEYLHTMSMDPHDAAVGAYVPGVTPSIETLEARIRARHAEAERRYRQSA